MKDNNMRWHGLRYFVFGLLAAAMVACAPRGDEKAVDVLNRDVVRLTRETADLRARMEQTQRSEVIQAQERERLAQRVAALEQHAFTTAVETSKERLPRQIGTTPTQGNDSFGHFTDFGASTSATRVPTTTPAPVGRSREPSTDRSDVLGVEFRVTESNDSWSRFAWILRVRNSAASTRSKLDATIKFLDNSGFVVDTDREYGLTIQPGETKEVTGSALITASSAGTVKRVSADVSFR